MARKEMPVKEFRDSGLLQEANRLFFHPRGVALAVGVDADTGECELGPIIDSRGTPGGIVFGDIADDALRADKAARVEKMRQANLTHRESLFGEPGGIQPVDSVPKGGDVDVIVNDDGVDEEPPPICPMCGSQLWVDRAALAETCGLNPEIPYFCYDCGALGTYQELVDLADSRQG